jgi:murein DD-endopeptidase MepM/ murein hydrolase activator NlpD
MRDKEIHNTGNMWRHYFPRHHLLAACGISLALTLLLSILPDSVIANRSALLTTDSIVAPLPIVESVATIDTVAPPIIDPWLHLTVRKGDTLSSLLQKAGLSVGDIHDIVNGSKDAKELANLTLNDKLDLLLKDGQVQELRLHRSALESVTTTRQGDSYQTQRVTRIPEVRQGFATGIIDSSLFLAAQKAGLNDRMTIKLADIFAYDIDFAQDIQDGDSFSVLYEDMYLDGNPVGQGKILAAEFTNMGKVHRSVLYTNQDGSSRYYTPEGELMRKQFLRTPLDFARITSYFSLKRLHPILHKIRAHKGIDYSAPQGTPIKAAGDGTVSFAGVRNGFGNVVMIQHGGAYTTVYGHMQKINVRTGARVEQGQTIGLVGKTGLATAPHLHYEFHVNGVAVNPLTNNNMAMSEPLSKAEKARFSSVSAPLFKHLTQRVAAARQSQNIAMTDTATSTSAKATTAQ